MKERTHEHERNTQILNLTPVRTTYLFLSIIQ